MPQKVAKTVRKLHLRTLSTSCIFSWQNTQVFLLCEAQCLTWASQRVTEMKMITGLLSKWGTTWPSPWGTSAGTRCPCRAERESLAYPRPQLPSVTGRCTPIHKVENSPFLLFGHYLSAFLPWCPFPWGSKHITLLSPSFMRQGTGATKLAIKTILYWFCNVQLGKQRQFFLL